jgi:hypothetical protein
MSFIVFQKKLGQGGNNDQKVFIYVFLLFEIMCHCSCVPRKAGQEVARETGQLLCAPITMIAHSVDGFRYLTSLCYPEMSAQPNLIILRTHRVKLAQPSFTFKLQSLNKRSRRRRGCLKSPTYRSKSWSSFMCMRSFPKKFSEIES